MRSVREFNVSEDDSLSELNIEICSVNCEEENRRLLTMIRKITDRGNNAEVKKKGDGSFTVYEVKKNKVTV